MAGEKAGSGEWQVVRVCDCRLRAEALSWPFAAERADDVDRHWRQRSAEMPGFFNGRVLMMAAASMQLDPELGGGHFAGTLFEVEFKQFLYWRETGYRDPTVRDAFGSALIRSAEGHVLLGRQRAGNVNAGFAYPPGGFIDRRDVAPGGEVDIAASIAREVAEETGLDPGDLVPAGGFWLTRGGAQVSMAKEFRSPLSSDALRARMLAGIASDPEAELAGIHIVRGIADIDGTICEFARELLAAVLAADER